MPFRPTSKQAVITYLVCAGLGALVIAVAVAILVRLGDPPGFTFWRTR